ncbi:MAG: DNA-binding domain-containing protein [Kofleriaceae bacterium]
MALLWRAVRSDLDVRELTPFRSSGRLGVEAAIAIYKNAYWIRQHECLCELFPRLAQCLGATRFRDLVRRYLLAHPSSHPELEHLGADLPAFLATTPERHLACLAALELALLETALAPNSEVATLAAIRPSTFARARLRVVSSLRVVVLDDDALHVLHGESREVVGARAAVTVRAGFVTKLHLISRDEHAALELVRAGKRIGELLDAHAHDVSGLHQFLHRWFARSWFAAIEEEAP